MWTSILSLFDSLIKYVSSSLQTLVSISIILGALIALLNFFKTHASAKLEVKVERFDLWLLPFFETVGQDDYVPVDDRRDFCIKLDLVLSAINRDIYLKSISLKNNQLCLTDLQGKDYPRTNVKMFQENWWIIKNPLNRNLNLSVTLNGYQPQLKLRKFSIFRNEPTAIFNFKHFYDYQDFPLKTYRISKLMDMILPQYERYEVRDFKIPKDSSKSLSITFILSNNIRIISANDMSTRIDFPDSLPKKSWSLDIAYGDKKNKLKITPNEITIWGKKYPFNRQTGQKY